jgi:hypothetical protein
LILEQYQFHHKGHSGTRKELSEFHFVQLRVLRGSQT